MTMKNSNYICRKGNAVQSIPKGSLSKETNDALALLRLENRELI